MKLARALVLLTLSHAAALTIAPSARAVQEPSAAEVELTADLLAAVEEAVALENSVGLSVAVAFGDDLVLAGGYGLAEVEHGVAAGADTLFRIGSITKQFTAAAVMQLVEQGKIELDADLRTYLPDFSTGEHVVTIRNLLTHSSGLKSYTNVGPTWRKTVPLELSDAELLAFIADEPFEFAPGERFQYNNTGYYLLGMIVAKVSGKSYAEHVTTRLAGPLGLERTRYGSNRDLIEDRAQGYQLAAGELANDDLIGMSQPGAAGALLSTARELVLWQRALVSGRVVSEESYTLMTTPYVTAGGRATSYGFGLGIATFEDSPRVGHGGGINGFNSMLAYFPRERLSVAVISNCEAYDAGALADRLARIALGVD